MTLSGPSVVLSFVLRHSDDRSTLATPRLQHIYRWTCRYEMDHSIWITQLVLAKLEQQPTNHQPTCLCASQTPRRVSHLLSLNLKPADS